MPCLTLLGTVSIQDFIYRSNRLRENLGASEMVRHAMRYWQNKKEKIYVGGGNAALRFGSKDLARAAVAEWSRNMLQIAPGLRLAVAHAEYKEGQLAGAFDEARDRLFEAENRPPLGAELGALPLVRPCPSTGMAASELAKQIVKPQEEDDVEDFVDDVAQATWLSAEAQAKRQYYWDHTNTRLKRDYGAALKSEGCRYVFPRDLDCLGTVEGASQAALVHADGNGIGECFEEIFKAHRARSDDEGLCRDLRGLSGDVATRSLEAFRALLKELIDVLPRLEKEGTVKLVQPRNRENRKIEGRRYLPLRPIVDDGDDLTFVCHGRLGLALARRYLELFEEKSEDRQFTASAGVLIMPRKFPFAQGYALTEDLCRSAKTKRRSKDSKAAWLDFHVLMEGRAGNLEALRDRYPAELRREPYCLGDEEKPWRVFEQTSEEVRKWPRSKAKQLFQTYASGLGEAETVFKSWAKEQKLSGSVAGAYDALEMLDFYVPVDRPAAGAGSN